jgi:hypothetical protein
MNTNASIRALRRANPRAKAGFAESVEATADALHARIATTGADTAADATPARIATTATEAPHGRVAATGADLAVEAGAPGRVASRPPRGVVSCAPPRSARWSRRRPPWRCS